MEPKDPNSELDHHCRAVKALLETTEGPAIAKLEFPVFMMSLGREVDVEVRAWRCQSGCDEVHVQVEINTPRVFDWNQDRSDTLLFGELTEEPE